MAEKLNDLYDNKSMSEREKTSAYARMQLEHVRSHPPEEVARSQLQGFDMRHEAKRGHSDFVKDPSYIQGDHWGPDSHLAFRTTDEVMHQRMASRPFVSYAKFDVAKFSDYGTNTYDKHEDSLDESGRMVGEAAFVPIKNSRTMWENQAKAHPQAARTKVYVRTYGALRSAKPEDISIPRL